MKMITILGVIGAIGYGIYRGYKYVTAICPRCYGTGTISQDYFPTDTPVDVEYEAGQ